MPSGSGTPGMAGKPIAAWVGATSSPRSRRGYWLGGGRTPFTTQSTRAFCSARSVSLEGLGFGASSQQGCGGIRIEAAGAAAVAHAGRVIAPDIGGERDIAVGAGADKVG